MSAIHHIAQTGFGTGTNELYDRARPTYQSRPISFIRKSVRGDAPLNIVEIGSGTGIFTRALLAHPEWANDIKELKALEPSSGMRDVFSKTIKDERVSTADGAFDATGIEDRWADLVIIAQAFHWCPDFDTASAEFSRILKPNGIVALIWNLEDRDAATWVGQLRDRVESHEDGAPQYRQGLWRKVFDTPSYNRFFDAPEENPEAYTLPATLSVVTDRVCSKSYIALLPEDKKKKVVEDVTAIVNEGDGKVWIDEKEGIFEYPYQTLVVICRKK